MRLRNKAIWLVLAMVALAGFGSAGEAAAQPQGRTVTLTVHYRTCAEVPADGDYFTACHDNPMSNSYIAVYSEAVPGAAVAEGTTDAGGDVIFSLFAGTYSLVGAPGDFLDASMIFCSRDSAPGEPIAYPMNLGTGDQATCDYYIVPGCNDVDGDCTPAPAPPANGEDTDEVDTVATLPNTGLAALDPDGLTRDVWPLAGVALAFALAAINLRRRFA